MFLTGPGLIALVPALCLAGYVAFGRPGLIAFSIGLPLVMLATAGRFTEQKQSERRRDPVTGLALRNAAVTELDGAAMSGGISQRSVAALAVGLEEMEKFEKRYGDRAGQRVLKEAAERLVTVIRQSDVAVRLEGPRFGIALTRLQRVDLEMMIEISSRVQTALSEPFSLDGTHVYVSVSIGMCLPPIAPEPSGHGLMLGAERALSEAMAITGSTIRRYSEDMRQYDVIGAALARDAEEALGDGRIVPWFQPQVSTDTGQVTGVEALARWDDPEHGMISPGRFLPAIEAEGLTERLGEVILNGALTALKNWDAAGVRVPTVGVNVSDAELRNPKFCDRIRWELDRHEIPPERLTIEVLETVTSDSDVDVVSHNLWGLAQLGCQIDMDDFGTGNASLAALRRFSVDRIKIDRSYVSDVDSDQAQQSMVAAIVTMAEQLDLETLAEGVETEGEHAMVAQLGCRHVQGFGIARPMSEAKCTEWLNDYEARHGPETVLKITGGAAKPTSGSKGNGKTA